MAQDNVFYSLNNKLKTLCSEHGIDFIVVTLITRLDCSKKMVYNCHLWRPLGLVDCLGKEDLGKSITSLHAVLPGQ